jgi:hypothetical protein
MNLQIRKRGGELEPWSVDKTINSAAVAGTSMKMAEAIGKLIESWAEKNAENGIVSSLQIRDKLVEVLAVVDSVAAEAYKAFKK